MNVFFWWETPPIPRYWCHSHDKMDQAFPSIFPFYTQSKTWPGNEAKLSQHIGSKVFRQLKCSDPDTANLTKLHFVSQLTLQLQLANLEPCFLCLWSQLTTLSQSRKRSSSMPTKLSPLSTLLLLLMAVMWIIHHFQSHNHTSVTSRS